MRESVVYSLGGNLYLYVRLKLSQCRLRHFYKLDCGLARCGVCNLFLHLDAAIAVCNEVLKPDASNVLDKCLEALPLLRHRCLGCLLYRENSASRCALGVYFTSSRVSRSCKVSRDVNQVLLELHYVGGHLCGGNRANHLANVVYGRSVGLYDAADPVKVCYVINLAGVDNRSRVSLVLDRQEASHLGLVYLDLVRDEVSNLALASRASFLVFPVHMCNGIQLDAKVYILKDVNPSRRHGIVDVLSVSIQLVYDGNRVVNLNLCGFASLVERVVISDNHLELVVAQAFALRELYGIGDGHSLANQDVRLGLNIRIVLVRVVDVVLVNDLVHQIHILFVKINVEDALVVDCGVLRDLTPLGVHLVTLPDSRRVSVQHLAESLCILSE